MTIGCVQRAPYAELITHVGPAHLCEIVTLAEVPTGVNSEARAASALDSQTKQRSSKFTDRTGIIED